MSGSSLPVLPLAGSLLVATPSLEDPNFHRTVLVMLAFAPDEGALAVVLNRPNAVPVDALLPGWGDLTAPPDSVFVGGPVAPENFICLAELKPEFAEGFDGCSRIEGRLANLDLNRHPYEMAPGVERIRIFSGYAGWSAAQLEREIERGGWLVLPAGDDVFTADPDGLWRRVLRRQGGHVALYANAPPHLSMN